MKFIYFSVDVNNVKQRRNNAVIFDIGFYNVNQSWKNVVNMTKVEKTTKYSLTSKKDDSFD